MSNISLVPQEPIVDITNRDSLIAWLTWNDYQWTDQYIIMTLETALTHYFDQSGAIDQ